MCFTRDLRQLPTLYLLLGNTEDDGNALSLLLSGTHFAANSRCRCSRQQRFHAIERNSSVNAIDYLARMDESDISSFIRESKLAFTDNSHRFPRP